MPPAADGTPVAAFDFDGTLSRRDTFLPFLQRVCGAQRLYTALARSGPALSRVAVGRADRDAVKDALLVRLLAGHPAAALAEAGQVYAEFLRRSDRLRPDTLARARAHLERGHRVVLVSASGIFKAADKVEAARTLGEIASRGRSALPAHEGTA